jgi:hypothetical protein
VGLVESAVGLVESVEKAALVSTEGMASRIAS